MKLFSRIIVVVLILVLGFGLVWAAADYSVSPPPSGEVYHLVEDWPNLPEGVVIGQASGVGIDSNGDVFVFHRADKKWQGEPLIHSDLISHPTVFVLDPETGDLLKSWGANTFVMPHGLTIDQNDNVWLTDIGLHQVFKFDRDGNLLMVLGEAGIAGDDSEHFYMPTDVAVSSSDGSVYITDGYGNSRVAKFSADGEFITTWGSYGTAKGQFQIPHGITLDAEGRVYVADRGNSRVQIFDQNGTFIDEWKNKSLGRPWAVRFDSQGNLLLVDGGDQSEFWPDRARVLKLDSNGNVLASFGSYGQGPGQFIWPHTIAIGPDGALYVGEVATGMRIQKFTKDDH